MGVTPPMGGSGLKGALVGLLTDRHFSPNRVMLFPETRTGLILNPKVGSSFLRDLVVAGLAEHRGVQDPSEGRYRILSMARRMPLAPVSAYRDFLRNPADWSLHTIVRNPYARLVSAWRDKFRDGHAATPDGRLSGYPRSIRNGVLKKARAHAAAQGLEGSRDGTLLPFDSFLSFALSEPEGRRNKHWEEQHRVILYDHLPGLRTIRMEDGLADPLAEIFAPMGFPADWVRSRAAAPVNPSSKLKEPVMTEANAEKARKLYARDLDLFGYAPDSWKGL